MESFVRSIYFSTQKAITVKLEDSANCLYLIVKSKNKMEVIHRLKNKNLLY